MTVALIAAMARNRVIGCAQQLPWRLPEDLKRFKATTMGHALLMGRATFDAIGRPLPGRRSIVVTRQAGWSAPGVEVVHSIDAGLALAADGGDPAAPDGQLFVAGGGDIFQQTIEGADRLYLTLIDLDVEGDTFFPEFDAARFREVERESHPNGPLPFTFVTLERRS
jgi:dihydrofolate reductase